MKHSDLCIVDTSVFVDFFRGTEIPIFEKLVLENRILLSPFVKIELLVGVRKIEEGKLRHVLDGLIELVPDYNLFSAAEVILAKMRGKGVSLGTVDLLIAAQANLGNFPLLSHDKVFKKIAETKLIKLVSL